MAQSKAKKHESKGLGFFSTLGLIFVVLKLTGNIDWNWFTVLWPFWLPPIVMLGAAAFITLIKEHYDEKHK